MKSGFVALVGRPNVGKSTLLNALVGHKVAITSEKPQTTRRRILGILNLPGAQIMFVDTPGVHRPHHLLGKRMVGTAVRTFREADLVLHVVDGSRPVREGDRQVAQLLRTVDRPVLLVVNKQDLAPRQTGDDFRGLAPYREVLAVSALREAGLERLVERVVAWLPEGPRYYPEDAVTDQPAELVIAELVREKVLGVIRQEVPHAVAVEVEEMAPRGRVTHVRAVIYVEKESQKGILIGRGGTRLKEIGTLARSEVEEVLGTPAYLELWVKVRGDWRNRPGSLESLGFREH